MDCTRCHKVKELAKGKRWCKDCKNAYEKKRRSKPENREKTNNISREKYLEKKKELENIEIVINPDELKTCTVCNETKTLDKFFQAKCKGTIRSMCKDCSCIKRKEYYQEHRKEVINQTNNYKVEKMKKDPLFKLERYMRARIYNAFVSQGLKKDNSTFEYLGCSNDFFKKWIEFQLYDGMTMENYGKVWHIDHVKPCASYNLNDNEQVKECFNWKNLRPLLASKNYSKSDKVEPIELVLQEFKTVVFQKGVIER
jgi:hypothetical protein